MYWEKVMKMKFPSATNRHHEKALTHNVLFEKGALTEAVFQLLFINLISVIWLIIYIASPAVSWNVSRHYDDFFILPVTKKKPEGLKPIRE